MSNQTDTPAADQKPTRIEPMFDPSTGAAIHTAPPVGGSWIRDVDGGLTPGDETTAKAANLAWAG